MAPLNKSSVGDKMAEEMATEFNVSYNLCGVNKISTVKKTVAFISLGNNQD
jgi:hypothetical protein